MDKHIAREQARPRQPIQACACIMLLCLFILYFWCFSILGALLTLEGLPLPGLAETVNNSVFRYAFHMQTDIEAILPTISFMELLHSWPIFPCSNHPRARCQTTRNNTEPTETIKNSQSAYAALSIPSHRNHHKDLAHIFPLFLLPPDWPCVACSMVGLLFLRSVSEKHSLQWHLFLNLLALPYLNKH